MNYNFINNKILEVFQKCNIKSFPLNCFELFKYYNLNLVPYSSLNEALYEYCIKYSDDAFWFKDKIFYNDGVIPGRIKFSLMHELGHFILNHNENKTPEMEQEANYFASNILAPRIIIHYSQCKNETDVSNLFHITNECARYAFNDYKKWRMRKIKYKSDSADDNLYNHFYNSQLDEIIYKIHICPRCFEELYNDGECASCMRRDLRFGSDSLTADFYAAEHLYLYGKDGGGLEL